MYKLNTDNSVRTVMWDKDVRQSRIRKRGLKKTHKRISKLYMFIGTCMMVFTHLNF